MEFPDDPKKALAADGLNGISFAGLANRESKGETDPRRPQAKALKTMSQRRARWASVPPVSCPSNHPVPVSVLAKKMSGAFDCPETR